jgi:FAD binding domain
MPGYREPAGRKKDRLFGGASTSDFPVLAEESLREFIAARAPWFKGSIGEMFWRNVVRFEKRLASAFGLGRLWLAGDAAHLAGPAGVQSMNVGIAEAAGLARIIARVLNEGAPFNEFDSYNTDWTREWLRLLSGKPDPWVAARADRILSCLPAHGDELERLVSQLGLSFAAPELAAVAH